MEAKDTAGRCQYCGDPIYRLSALAHDGCARLAGIREVVARMGLIKPPVIKARDKVAFYAGYQRAKEDWQAKLKEWGIKQ